MPRFEAIDRRTFLTRLGGASLGIVIFGAAACRSEDPDLGVDATDTPPPEGPEALGGWRRVALGSVSAYVLIRGGEAVVVDTGVAGSADDIEAALSEAGSAWGDVGHVILTHKHPDHIGSAEEVLTRASEATAYAGELDIPAITAPREITPVGDDDTVFGLDIVATPGHTPGHISVLDPEGSVFVAGDALVTTDGTVAGPPPEFTEDMDTALGSVAKIATLSFGALLVGHGDPIEDNASAQVVALT